MSGIKFLQAQVKTGLISVSALMKPFNSIKSSEFPYMYKVTEYATQRFLFPEKALLGHYEAKKRKTVQKGRK